MIKPIICAALLAAFAAVPVVQAEEASTPGAGTSGSAGQPAPGVGKAEKPPTLDAAGPNITASDPDKGSQSSGTNAADIAKGDRAAAHGQKPSERPAEASKEPTSGTP